MKYIIQFTIITIITFISEMLNRILPLPIPASVYGLVILFLCLCLQIIKLEQVEDVADFFVKIMPIFFIGPSVMIITAYQDVVNNLLVLIIITVISTIVTMGVSGMAAQFVLNRKEERRNKNE